MQKKVPVRCPSCESLLKVKKMGCSACDTLVEGSYELPLTSYLNSEEQQFVLDFVRSSGSLKEMSSLLGLSYPTVRNMLNDLIEKVSEIEQELSIR